MTKKNVLLYLDAAVVNYAKKQGLNISQISENAIRQNLFPYLSTGERAILDFKGYLKELHENKQCFFLPFPVKEIVLRNVGRFPRFETSFSQSGNVINGQNGAGKTTILRSLAYAAGVDEFSLRNLLHSEAHHGSIQLKIDTTGTLRSTISLNADAESLVDGRTRCLLLDDAIDVEKYLHFGGKKYELLLSSYQEFFRRLKESRVQVIMTARFSNEQVYEFYSTVFPRCKFITLE